MKKLISLSLALLLTISLNAAVTNLYQVNTDPNQISIQPIPYDLWQDAGTTNFIMKNALHGVVPDGTLALYDSRYETDFGDIAHGYNGGCVLFQDGISPTNDVIIHVDFDAAKAIQEVRVYSQWGDQRQFAYFDVYASTSGTNDGDYTYLGTTLNGEFGETNSPPNVAYYRVARLLDDTGAAIANNVTSLNLFKETLDMG